MFRTNSKTFQKHFAFGQPKNKYERLNIFIFSSNMHYLTSNRERQCFTTENQIILKLKNIDAKFDKFLKMSSAIAL